MAYIRVKDIATGKTGRMPEENFDPNKYVRLDEGIVRQLAEPITRSFERMAGAGESIERKQSADQLEQMLATAKTPEDYEKIQKLSQQAGQDSALTAGAQQDIYRPDAATTLGKANPLQMGKDLAAVASFGMPAGTIAQGAATGAVGGFGYSEEGKEGVLKISQDWPRNLPDGWKKKLLSPVTNAYLAIVTEKNRCSLIERSEIVRRQVRGEEIGMLG